MIGVAVTAALDPDYPLPRSVANGASAAHGLDLMPKPLAPRGAVAEDAVRFRWTWTGPRDAAFDLVLLDEQLDEIYRRPVRGNELAVDAELRQVLDPALAAGGQLHWYVVAAEHAGALRTAPVAFGFRR